MAGQWLHGILDVTIFEAKDIVNLDRASGSAPKILREVLEGFESATGLGKDASDCYCTVDLPPARMARTSIVHNTTHPRWNETFRIYCAHKVTHVYLVLKDKDQLSANRLGQSMIDVNDVVTGESLHNWFPLFNEEFNPVPGQICAALKYTPATGNPAYTPGEGTVLPYAEVPFTYFHLQKGCKVSLYQDAHVLDNLLPPITLENGEVYEPARCWEDIYTTISNAQHFVYLTGWSVYDKIRLVRDLERPIPGSEGVTLGELLKRKAEEGVRVCMLVWDDKTSSDNPLLKAFMGGLMATHDEDTSNFFKDSKVHCLLCPRTPSKALSDVQALSIGTMFTHHQKTVMADFAAIGQQLDSPERRLVAFVGGIDLCDGRYDNQHHSLFRTLNDIHSDDFHQACYAEADLKKGGPREPWHDIHCKVEGPVAWDILHNFEQRWKKQAHEIEEGAENLLLNLNDIPQIEPPALVVDESDPEAWMSQVFRSIDEGAAADLPNDPDVALAAGLIVSKGSIIDRSMQDAWIHHIRRAQHFLYIENQYFLGSCYGWDSSQDCGCLNLIPMEIALKVASKIRANEPFVAYILLPMYPEGFPESGSVQAILHWQYNTMSMMYRIIYEALQEVGRDDAHPADFLRFFTVANRETPVEGELQPEEGIEGGTYYHRAHQNRRFMIYVHSKMLIVDDEYVIVGSANINQRSMDGARDSEIGAGSFQPAHTWAAKGGPPKGQIHGFRMSLWAEHTGTMADTFAEPWTLECSRMMANIGIHNWTTFQAEEIADMRGHLMVYPVIVAHDGTISAIPNQVNFPDAENAPILGTKSGSLPSILTT